MANTKSNSQAQPGAAQLGAKTLSRRQARLDRFVAWFFSFLLLVVVVGLWGVSRFVVDKENAGGDTTVGYVLGGITAVTYLVVSLYSWRRGRRRQKRTRHSRQVFIHHDSKTFGYARRRVALVRRRRESPCRGR